MVPTLCRLIDLLILKTNTIWRGNKPEFFNSLMVEKISSRLIVEEKIGLVERFYALNYAFRSQKKLAQYSEGFK